MQDNRHLYPASNKVISHLTAVSEELVDVPLYFSLHEVCKTVKCSPPKADVLRSALINAGENMRTCNDFSLSLTKSVSGVSQDHSN